MPLFYRETLVVLLAMRATGFRLSATRRPHLVAITVARTEATLSGRCRMKCRLVERRPPRPLPHVGACKALYCGSPSD
jgi:hypothetical protein